MDVRDDSSPLSSLNDKPGPGAPAELWTQFSATVRRRAYNEAENAAGKVRNGHGCLTAAALAAWAAACGPKRA